MNKITLGLALGSMTLLSGGLISPTAQAQVTQQSGGYLMRMNWKKGQTFKFNISMSMGAAGGQSQGMTRQTPVTIKVVDVAKGVATVDVTSQPPTAGANAKPNVSRMKMDNRGRAVGGDSNLSLLIGLPEKPVKVGGTWKDTFQARNQMGAPMKVNATYTLRAVRNGRAEISASNTGAGGSMSTSGTGTYVVDMKDGMLRSANFKQTVTVTMAQGKDGKPQKATIPTTVTLTRI